MFADKLRALAKKEYTFDRCLAETVRACEVAAESGRFQAKVYIEDQAIKKAVGMALENGGITVRVTELSLEMYWHG